MTTLGEKSSVHDDKRPGFHVWLLAALCCVLGGLAAFRYDITLAVPERPDWMPGDLSRVVELCEIFAHGFGVILIAAGIWSLVPEKRRFLPRLFACVLFPGLTAQLLKIFFARQRPRTFLKNHQHNLLPEDIFESWEGWLPHQRWNIEYFTQSFPSAHTTTVFGLAIGMSWMFPRGRVLFFSVAVLASLQRITSKAHWTSDVFFGAAIAFLIAGALTYHWGLGHWLGRIENRFSPQSSAPGETVPINRQEAA